MTDTTMTHSISESYFQRLCNRLSAAGLKPSATETAPGHLPLEVTWWADDGAECRGRVSLAPDAAPDTTPSLARMMRRAEAPDAENDQRRCPLD